MAAVRLLDTLATVAPRDWDALRGNDDPFVSHAFLHGLEVHGCLRPDWGWTPHHLGLWDGGRLLAAAPAYLKTNSHGEFVFDHAWAHAYARHGLDYFPKLLCAVPYSPVTGPRLLAPDAARRRARAGCGARSAGDDPPPEQPSPWVQAAPSSQVDSTPPFCSGRTNSWRTGPTRSSSSSPLDASRRGDA